LNFCVCVRIVMHSYANIRRWDRNMTADEV